MTALASAALLGLFFEPFSLVGGLFDAVRDPAGLLGGQGETDMRLWVLPDDLDADVTRVVADLPRRRAKLGRRLIGIAFSGEHR